MYEKNVRSDRQGFGLHPEYLNEVLGSKAIINIEKGIPFELCFINHIK